MSSSASPDRQKHHGFFNACIAFKWLSGIASLPKSK
jgi:hypothetical protein